MVEFFAAISFGVGADHHGRSTIVLVAMPNMIDSLDLDHHQVQWVQEVYTLVFAALLMVAGNDQRSESGDVWLLVIGLVIFVAASILCARRPARG